MKTKNFFIKLNNRKIPFYYKDTIKDTGGYFAKIILGKLYEKIKLKNNVKTIIDLGANIGAASICFALWYPNAKVYSFEPVSETYELLQINTKEFPNIKTFNRAASDNDASLKIYTNPNKPGISSLIKNHMNFEFTDFEFIQAVNFKKFLEEKNINHIGILKIDTEGSELNILNNISSILKQISLIYIEVHGESNIRYVRSILNKSHEEIKCNDMSEILIESIFIKKEI